MFCYQCEQTVGGKGCTKRGVCGKTPGIGKILGFINLPIEGKYMLCKRNP